MGALATVVYIGQIPNFPFFANRDLFLDTRPLKDAPLKIWPCQDTLNKLNKPRARVSGRRSPGVVGSVKAVDETPWRIQKVETVLCMCSSITRRNLSSFRNIPRGTSPLFPLQPNPISASQPRYTREALDQSEQFQDSKPPPISASTTSINCHPLGRPGPPLHSGIPSHCL